MLLDIKNFHELKSNSEQLFDCYTRVLALYSHQRMNPQSTPKGIKNKQVLIFDEDYYLTDELVLNNLLDPIKKIMVGGSVASIFQIICLKQVSVSNHPKYKEFIKIFNEITGKKSRGDKDSRRKFAEAYEKYGLDGIARATRRAKISDFHRDNNMQYLTPEYILRDKILDRYLSMPEKNEPKPKKTAIYSGN